MKISSVHTLPGYAQIGQPDFSYCESEDLIPVTVLGPAAGDGIQLNLAGTRWLLDAGDRILIPGCSIIRMQSSHGELLFVAFDDIVAQVAK